MTPICHCQIYVNCLWEALLLRLKWFKERGRTDLRLAAAWLRGELEFGFKYRSCFNKSISQSRNICKTFIRLLSLLNLWEPRLMVIWLFILWLAVLFNKLFGPLYENTTQSITWLLLSHFVCVYKLLYWELTADIKKIVILTLIINFMGGENTP